MTNLGLLGCFKYFGFFASSFAGALETLGLQADWPTMTVLLPVGISFYTFQTLSYTIDVYHRKLEPVNNSSTHAVVSTTNPENFVAMGTSRLKLIKSLERHYRR